MENFMGRPVNCRKIDSEFNYTYFKPRGVPMSELQEVTLSVDELEALRLTNLEELYQEDAAKKMGVSRQTLGNIVKSARRKITDALVNGKAMCISGGDVHIENSCCGKGRNKKSKA